MVDQMGTSQTPWAAIKERDRRGSRARCIQLTDGSDLDVARRLTVLAQPIATVDPKHDRWMPRGFAAPKEAKLGDAVEFLSAANRGALTSWWLSVRDNANTPNWDIVSTATIDGRQGLLLVEAKAHDAELKKHGKPSGRSENDESISAACTEASVGLSSALGGWALSAKSHYQLCNRFAWAWKVATLGIPVVLIYLGFTGADEMRDQGLPFASADDWEHLVKDHSRGIVPEAAWSTPMWFAGTPMHAIIRASDVALVAG